MTQSNEEQYQPHELRVIEERDQLQERWKKLGVFLGSHTCAMLSVAERHRLLIQFDVMRTYLQILELRIAAFTEGKEMR